MGGSRFGWAVGAIAPWWLGVALALSMPADAEQEAVSGASLAALSLRAPAPPQELIPPQIPGLAGALRQRPAADSTGRADAFGSMPRLLREASLVVGEADRSERLPDEIEPRSDLKRNAGKFPTLDRSRRADPVVGLRPTFDTRLRQRGGLANLRAHDLLFEHDEAWPVSGFDVSEGDFAGPDSVSAFEPWPDGETPTTAPSAADASPRQNGGSQTMRPAALTERLMQGATPEVRRAEALASTTPAPADSTPVEVAAIAAPPQVEAPDDSTASYVPSRPGFAALIGHDRAAQEQRCLAEAIYFEARGESDEGQAAVAQVVMNRVSSGLYPPTICGVVFQNRHRRNACQFSFACEGRALRITEADAWRRAVRIAGEVTAGTTYVSDVGGATHYHANYVRPRWARSLEKMDVIGHHIFYKLRPGQT
ncbi:cell wall hydrolase [Methylocella tundrae]|uniref:Cell wall hydrolase n=2 Tax=Methylocella tundrae TaxID=227605 RepID=A0A4U8YWF1_METTU|nr:cell wall hydrolase [Methylocella tundrae]VFU07597.1 Cell wall hydrolase [Methylocella tundrae]